MECVCLDTHILIWGIKEECKKGQEDMISKAKAFLKWLDDEKIKPLIPTVVLGELLMPIPSEKHNEYISIFQNNFLIVSYDVAAASCFAKIWHSKIDNKTIEKIKTDHKLSRSEIKADLQIVAIAVTQKVSCIYSYDSNVKKFAEGYIEVKEMPILSKPMKLPFNSKT